MGEKSVVLTGFMGTGKSTIGKLLAAELGCRYVDTDGLIETRAGSSIAEIFRQDGEAAFRQWESVIANELAGQAGLVISTGGRLMLDDENAALLGQNAHVFCLTAEADEIIDRLRQDGGQRPLLDVADPAERIRALLSERAEKYGRFSQISTSGRPVEDVVKEIVQCISAMSKTEKARK